MVKLKLQLNAKNGVKSVLKIAYHNVGPFCNLFATSLQFILFSIPAQN